MVTEPIARNDSVTFTGFLHRLDQCTDPRLNIHLVMDNGPSHTSRATRAWIAAHPRITVTYTPKHASWLDMAELWFSVLTRGPAAPRRVHLPRRPRRQDHRLRDPLQPDRQPWTWAYDARADHAAYLARHHDCVAAGPAASSALPAAA